MLLFAIGFFISLPISKVYGQLFGNPTVSVLVKHPPDLIINVKKYAFGAATGTCSDELVSGIVSDFVANGKDVIDRENLKIILAEHSFSLNSLVDQASTATIGKILGPSALITINVMNCTVQQEPLLSTERKYNQAGVAYNQTVYISRTRGFLKFAIRVTDLATSKVVASRTFDYTPERSNKSYTGRPEFPPTFEIQEMGVKSAVEDVSHLFFPWSEYKTLEFFDDKDYNMKEAFKALRDGNTDLSFNLSKTGLEECKNDNKAKDRDLCRSNYNLGISYMIKSQYDSALVYLNEAAKYKPWENLQKAINECLRAKNLQKRAETLESIAAYENTKQSQEEQKKAQSVVDVTLTNKGIIDMVQLKLPDAVILSKIKTSKCKFDTTPDALSTLTKSGVNEKIMTAMIEKQ